MNRKACRAISIIAVCLIFSASGSLLAQEKAPADAGGKEDKKAAVTAERPSGPVTEKAAISPGQGAPLPEKADAEPAKSTEGSAQKDTQEKEAVPEAPMTEPGNITVNFKGADIRTVLAYIAEVSGIDIVPAPDIKGIVDLKLTNKPWKVALDIIVRNYGFAYEREGDIIRVVTVDKLKQEELTTQTFGLNYGRSKDVILSIKDILSDRGKVTQDDRTNTVIVTDIPTNIYRIGQIVERLDKKTDQVLIEARVIETLLDDNEKLGIDWNAKFSVSGAKRPTTFPFESFKTPFNTKSGEMQGYFPQVLTASPQTAVATAGGGSTTTQASDFPSDAAGVFSFPFAAKDQFTFGTLDFSEFKAVLEFIKSRSNTEIVSNPRVATLNNSEALINVGQTLNLPKYERNSSTGKMEITGYEPKDLGIILKVTPHINPKGEIVVELAPQISDLLRYDTLDKASGVVAPVYSTRQAKTQIMIKDGDTIFIGGLIKENDVETRKKLPIIGDVLGDVPGLGMLFTKKEVTKQKTELIFFITVNLVTVDKNIKDIPKANKAYIPMFTLTQDESKVPRKKRELKRY